MAPSAEHPRRVAITGLGAVSPLGNTVASLREGLWAGKSGVGPLSWMAPLPGRVVYGGEAWDFSGQIDDFGNLEKDRKKVVRKALKMMCRETMMAVAVVQEATNDAGFDSSPPDPERCGVVFGSDYMVTMPDDMTAGMLKCGAPGGFRYEAWGSDGLADMNPLWMLKYLPNMPASHIAITFDLRGPNNSLTMREAAGLAAIREAVQTIRRGHADRMIAGATGTRIHPLKTIHAVQTERLADPTLEPAEACRPFDADRTGMVVGEGAAAVVLEEMESAKARGATIYGEVVGAASSLAADRNLKGDTRRVLETVARAALAGAGLDSVGHVNAHGLSTPESDVAEAEAIRAALGGSDTPVVALKSRFGNLGAASGVVELVGSVLALSEPALPPAINCPNPRPALPGEHPLRGRVGGRLGAQTERHPAGPSGRGGGPGVVAVKEMVPRRLEGFFSLFC